PATSHTHVTSLFTQRRAPQYPTPFPYTTLFRSLRRRGSRARAPDGASARRRASTCVRRHAASCTSHIWKGPRKQPANPCRNKAADRKSTRLNSSHVKISYAVFCLKKKKEE